MSTTRAAGLEDSVLWREASAMPETIQATLDAADGLDELYELFARPETKRIVATGNGASWYAALALWLASVGAPRGDAPEVLTVPGGLLAGGDLAWRDGDVLLAFSSSGEFRDVVEAIELDGTPRPFALFTANPDSTLGSAAGARGLVDVRSQDAITHTQGYCGAAVAMLGVWARLTDDAALAAAVADAPALAARTLEAAPAWAEEALARTPRPVAAVAFGAGPAWAAALEAALLLGEIAIVPSQGVEVREGATTAMYPLGPGQLALSLPTRGPAGARTQAADRLVREAEEVCERRGATVLRAPVDAESDPRLAILGSFGAPLALSILMAQRDGLDPDVPGWYADYLATARRTSPQ